MGVGPFSCHHCLDQERQLELICIESKPSGVYFAETIEQIETREQLGLYV